MCVCMCMWMAASFRYFNDINVCTCRMCIQTHCVTNWITIFISLFGNSLSVPSLLDWACKVGGEGEEGEGG